MRDQMMRTMMTAFSNNDNVVSGDSKCEDNEESFIKQDIKEKIEITPRQFQPKGGENNEECAGSLQQGCKQDHGAGQT